MINEHGVISLINQLLNQYFIQSTDVQSEIQKSNPLSIGEISFLEQLLWFCANITSDSDKSRVEALELNMDKYLGVIIHNYG